jgi:basic amino acid/polyamine antiporter, APA family
MMAIAVVVGTVIGSGIFKKPQSIAANVPEFGLAALVWILGGVLAILGALALAEVAVLYPRSGGNYVFLREAYGRLWGFLWGWVEFWIIRTASLAALATIFTESLCDILGPLAPGFWPQRWLTVAVIMGLAGVNVLGVRWGGGVQFLVTSVKVGSLLAIMALPFIVAALALPGSEAAKPQAATLTPIWPSDWSLFDLGKFTTALLGVLWAYHGWMNIAPVAEEVKNPRRNLPLALLAGTGIVMFLYLGANLAYYLVMPASELAAVRGDTSVAAAFTERLLGPMGASLAAAAVMCSVFGALNGNLLVGPRLLYAMGEDRLAPKALSDVHPRFRTPALAILVMAAWACILVVAAAALTRNKLPTIMLGEWEFDPNLPEKKPLFDVLTDFSMFGAVIFETMAVVSIFVFRWTMPDAKRPYRCWGYPVVPALYVVLPALILGNMFVNQRTEALIGAGFIALGAAVYYAFRLGRSAKPQAAQG